MLQGRHPKFSPPLSPFNITRPSLCPQPRISWRPKAEFPQWSNKSQHSCMNEQGTASLIQRQATSEQQHRNHAVSPVVHFLRSFFNRVLDPNHPGNCPVAPHLTEVNSFWRLMWTPSPLHPAKYQFNTQLMTTEDFCSVSPVSIKDATIAQWHTYEFANSWQCHSCGAMVVTDQYDFHYKGWGGWGGVETSLHFLLQYLCCICTKFTSFHCYRYFFHGMCVHQDKPGMGILYYGTRNKFAFRWTLQIIYTW